MARHGNSGFMALLEVLFGGNMISGTLKTFGWVAAFAVLLAFSFRALS